jgi:hypothetical protein
LEQIFGVGYEDECSALTTGRVGFHDTLSSDVLQAFHFHDSMQMAFTIVRLEI